MTWFSDQSTIISVHTDSVSYKCANIRHIVGALYICPFYKHFQRFIYVLKKEFTHITKNIETNRTFESY